MDFKEKLEELFQSHKDLIEHPVIRNPIFRKVIDRGKLPVYERKVHKYLSDIKLVIDGTRKSEHINKFGWLKVDAKCRNTFGEQDRNSQFIP